MTTLAERQKEFCGALMLGAPALGLVGLPMRSAAAIGGNATQESLCQPVTLGAKDHGSDAVLQWRLERLDGPSGLKAFCTARELVWATLKAQALFTLFELKNDYAVLHAELLAGTKSLETLTLNFTDVFERPSETGRQADKRIGYAHDCLAILMRDAAPGPFPVPIPATPATITPVGVYDMPIEVILQLVAPLAESLITGLLKGVLTHAQQTGTMPAHPAGATHPLPAVPASGLTAADFVKIAEMIAAEIAKLNAPKAAA